MRKRIYYPEYFEGTRPYLHSSSRHRLAEAVIPSTPDVKLNATGIADVLMDFYATQVKSKSLSPEDLWWEIEILTKYLRFRHYGRNILHLSPELLSLFKHSPIDDTRLSDLRDTPHRSFYLYFGGEGILVDQLLIDGAYVDRFEELSICITLTARNASLDAYPETYSLETHEWIYPFSLDPQQGEHGQSPDLVIEEAIADEIALRQTLPDLKLTGVEKEMRSLGYFEQFKAALPIVVNAILYFQSYPQDMETEFPPETPPELLTQLDRAQNSKKPKQLRNAINDLALKGYRRITYCGFQQKPGQGNLASSESVPGEVSERETFYRIRHPRWQRYGTGNTLRKRIWVGPVRVGKPTGLSEVPGRIYNVGESQQ